MTTVFTEGRHPAEFIVSEGNGRLSRDTVVVASGANLEPGTVVGKITASGKVAALSPSASDGAETAYGVLMYPAKATSDDARVVAIVRVAEVNGNLLVWPEGITDNQKAAAVADLEARGIVLR